MQYHILNNVIEYTCTCTFQYLLETADNLAGIHFKLHDFGFRGTTSIESSAVGGAAHLVNFKGTDNIPGVIMAR